MCWNLLWSLDPAEIPVEAAEVLEARCTRISYMQLQRFVEDAFCCRMLDVREVVDAEPIGQSG